MALVRFDVISDTHGYLSSELLEALQGANYIVHAGDITSNADYQTLQKIAPVKLCLGNNDFCYNYGPMVDQYACNESRKSYLSSRSRGCNYGTYYC